MNRQGFSIAILIALVATTMALALAPSAGAAPGGKAQIRPATQIAILFAPGTKGWHLQVTATLGSADAGRQSLGIYVKGPHHQTITYGARGGIKGRATEDGRIVGRVPGVGRIDVRFEQTSEKPLETTPQKGCTKEGKSAVLVGVFRGTIEFRGEGGYTKVDRTSARGEIWVTPRELCPPRKHQPASDETPRRRSGLTYLAAGRNLAGGSLTLDVLASLPEGHFPALTIFNATYTHRSHGVDISDMILVDKESEDLSTVTSADGAPTELAITPPGPFTGSATFKLESPTQASWTGDLAVDFLGLGKTSLAGPGWWAGACESTCTNTFPPGSQVLFG